MAHGRTDRVVAGRTEHDLVEDQEGLHREHLEAGRASRRVDRILDSLVGREVADDTNAVRKVAEVVDSRLVVADMANLCILSAIATSPLQLWACCQGARQDAGFQRTYGVVGTQAGLDCSTTWWLS